MACSPRFITVVVCYELGHPACRIKTQTMSENGDAEPQRRVTQRLRVYQQWQGNEVSYLSAITTVFAI